MLMWIYGTAGSALVAFALLSPAPKVNWVKETCTAEQAWVHHPTTANLDTMAADSFSAPWRFVGDDAWGLYSDVRSGAPGKYIKADEKYFGQDCP